MRPLPKRELVTVTITDDQPQRRDGLLIPDDCKGDECISTELHVEDVTSTPSSTTSISSVAFFTAAVLFFALSIGITAFNAVSVETSIASPIVVVEGEEPQTREELTYGTRLSLSDPDFYSSTKAGFIAAKETFIEADLATMKLRYYEGGEVSLEFDILSKGREGSWWETPSGLYAIESKRPNHFSSFGQVWQPWSMVFQGNFFIHGWPYYPDGTPVASGYSGGCIRLDSDDAKALFEAVKVGVPVLVHEASFAQDDFVYEPKVPEISAEQYLLADLKSSTVLASTDMDTTGSIASLTKLMTALVAAEYINLDSEVPINQELYVTTLIPRLDGRTTASMYSLLQLMLVESSNEAAEVIAAQTGRQRYIARMNQKAASIGLADTTFTDPSGLNDDNESTLRDLLRLTQYIYNNRSFVLDLTANENLATLYDAGDFGELTNFNDIDGVTNFLGGKVGETQAAGQTSLTLHKFTVNGSERVVALILLNTTDRPGDVKRMLRYMEERFKAE